MQKSKFLQKQVKYLGYIVGNGIIQTDPDKLQAIRDHSFSKSVRSFALLSIPLTAKLNTKNTFEWSEEANLSFENLKKQLCFAPLLHKPDFNRKSSVYENGEEVPIAYIS